MYIIVYVCAHLAENDEHGAPGAGARESKKEEKKRRSKN